MAWVAIARGSVRRSYVVVLSLAALHLAGASRLLSAWHVADRTEAPYLLPDLGPLRAALERHGIRRAYASYGPAYRLTYESDGRIVVSQPWNERFLHYPLPYLDDVRFAVGAAWILTPRIPSDLPTPQAFEAALRAAGGTWRRTDVGDAIVYHGFAPPYASDGVPLASAGAAGDGDLGTQVAPDRAGPTVLTLPAPQAMEAITLMAGFAGPPLLRSFDVEVSADGAAFEKVAERRRRGERSDLRWVNGHPQYVLDHDLLSIPLGGRIVARHPPDAGRLGRRLDARGGPAASRPRRHRALSLGRRARPRPHLARAPPLPGREPPPRSRGLVLPEAAGRAPLKSRAAPR